MTVVGGLGRLYTASGTHAIIAKRFQFCDTLRGQTMVLLQYPSVVATRSGLWGGYTCGNRV